jgi:CheY-like chemotaxis protein
LSRFRPKGLMKTLRHPPSRELWKFCMDRLRELRGQDTRERDLANILGFEHSRAVRWKEGQMYVDRAEYLVRLADALDVETMMLVALASGTLTQEQAQKQVGRSRTDEVAKRRRGVAATAKVEAADLNTDASLFAIDASRLESASRGVVLLIASDGEGRLELADVLARHSDMAGLAASSLAMGMCLADWYRPEMAFLDLGLASVHAFDACRVLASLSSRAGRRCRVVAGTATLTDDIEKPALMAGAASVTLLPFTQSLFQSELDRLEERLGPRRSARK